VGAAQELPEGVEVAEPVVDPRVVDGVITMTRDRFEDRGQVDRRGAQVADVVEMVDDAAQVATGEHRSGRLAAPRADAFGVQGGVAVGKPVREDLVEDGIADPGGNRRLWWLRHQASPSRSMIRQTPQAPRLGSSAVSNGPSAIVVSRKGGPGR